MVISSMGTGRLMENLVLPSVLGEFQDELRKRI
jgi:hypothetical protein